MQDPFQSGFQFGQQAVNQSFAQNALSRYAGGEKAAVNDLMRFDPEQAMRLQDQERQNALFDQGQQDRQRQEQMMQQRQQLGQQAAGGDLEGAYGQALGSGDFEGAQELQQLIASGDKAAIAQAEREADMVGGLSYTLLQVPAEQRAAWVQQNAPKLQSMGIDPSQLGELDDTSLNLYVTQATGVKTMLANQVQNQRLEQQAQYQNQSLDIRRDNANRPRSGGGGGGGYRPAPTTGGTNDEPPDAR